ncbi:MAG: CRTAC1 family protein, partial [Rhodothermales bacterium]|nr:CRTAC1 family protein [Rhodothermales bacterium]
TAASEYLARARETGVEDSRVLLLSGIVELRLDRAQTAMGFLNSAIHADSSNTQALYALASEARYRGAGETSLNPETLLNRILETRPDNTVAILELMRLAAEANDTEQYGQRYDRLVSATETWPSSVKAELASLDIRTESRDLTSVVSAILRFGNRALRVDAHRQSLRELQIDPLDPALVMNRFVAMPTPSGGPAPAESTLVFSRVSLTSDAAAYDWLGSVFLSDEGPLVSAAANRSVIRVEPDAVLPFPGGTTSDAFPEAAAAFFDYDYDFKMDLAVAGAGGLMIYRQTSAGKFSEQTDSVGLPPSVIRGSYRGVWALDIDLEGDMDLVLSRTDGPLRLLRNNGDDTFTASPVFEGVANVRQLLWVDIDDDGDPDAAVLDENGAVYLLRNERSGLFIGERLAEGVLAIWVSDFDGDGTFDLLTLDASKTVRATSWRSGVRRDRTLLEIPADLFVSDQPGPGRLRASDIDNNGGLDLIVSLGNQSAIWLQDSDRTLLLLPVFEDLRIFEAADLYGSGKLNLVALDTAGTAVHLINGTRREYLSRSILTRAADSLGDRRNNSFGIGGEIEFRSGLLYQRRSITSPLVHFGIGDHRLVDVARIIWPNGTSQALFDLESDQTLLTRESLKGSCPWVFTNDGQQMRFVTDFIWRSPLGLRINAVATAGIVTTEDWIKIDGDELAEIDGRYDVRITAELWETHFFDLIKLRVVDHPLGTEVFVNESFVFPPDELAVHVTGPLQAVAGAWDDSGQDVTELIAANDGRYVDTFNLYSHQGRTNDHFVEIDLGGIHVDRPVWLVAAGWIWPTDSSINVAIGQGDHPAPKGVRVDVENDDGTWTAVHADLGFPSGKTKTMLIDLTGVFDGRTSRRVRLATNLEIYWDSFSWAEALEDSLARITEVNTVTADLRYRGFSQVTGLGRSLPEIPVYDSLASVGPQWRDLIGFYTRFGDVGELLDRVDDRYMIMNAGDELSMTFEAPSPPTGDWRRDFVLVGDGWVKDGDYNTTYSKTVTPLPEHGVGDYTAPLIGLEDNNAFRVHRNDWTTYHTRYVSTDHYVNALRPVD